MAFGAQAEEFVETVNIHVTGDYVGVIVLLHYLRLFVFIADFPYDCLLYTSPSPRDA